MISPVRAGMVAICGAILILPSGAQAQHPQKREGFWFNVGIGYGTLGCSDCDTRISGASGGIALGGTVNQSLLIGVFSNGWTKSELGTTLSAGTLVLGLRYYPSKDGGFFLLGGLGISRVSLSSYGYGSSSVDGSGALIGIGYDIRVGDNVSLTPFWNGIGMSFSGGDANFGQLGLGLTIH